MLKTELGTFVERVCPRKNHFCDGRFIIDRMEPGESPEKDLGVCQYYDVEKGCKHPKHPKRLKQMRKE